MIQARSRCRNLRCRTKLPVPTDNHHKAFCTPYCHTQFYQRRCLVCEKPLPDGHRRQLCSARKCRLDYRNFRQAYVLEDTSQASVAENCQSDAKSPCGTGTKTGIKGPASYTIIAGPPLSDSALWAATLPGDAATLALAQAARANWRGWPKDKPNRPGDLAAEWTARELARREADDAQYVAEDEARLRTAPVDLSGNYAPRLRA